MDGMSGMGGMGGGMDGGMGGMNATNGTDGMHPQGHSCKISMLWNWYTVDACFLSKSWHVHSHGAFAGLCIGVILLVILLEFFRHASRQFDRYLADQAQERTIFTTQSANPSDKPGSPRPKEHHETQSAAIPVQSVRPNIVQQLIRSLLHTLQFATAYWIMLLAMYFNGYIIICIILGAFIGSFIFQWERLQLRLGSGNVTGSNNAQEVTGCCG
ncbi:Ctr copper transporter family-domain-containing protein [Xylaria sp. FL1042]|nr:Ctr copper transporter family-domain-containing protein [Xylaria sp. FL1042]